MLSVIAADGHIALLAAQSHVIALACDLDQVGYFAQRVLLELGQLLVQTNQFARHRAQLVEVLRPRALMWSSITGTSQLYSAADEAANGGPFTSLRVVLDSQLNGKNSLQAQEWTLTL